jgi:pseudaminic acid biosynthesis-associated methylase
MSRARRPTAQERFWRGAFGNDYLKRNAATAAELRARMALWRDILACVRKAPPRSVLEVGANIGNNLRALRRVTGATRFAVEPHAGARAVLLRDRVVAPGNLRDGIASAIGFPDGVADLAFTSGVLIHIHPRDLLASCREIHRVARRYVACVEYFSVEPEEIAYRGHRERLFKRDFGGFWLDHFPDLRLRGYGFVWRRATGLGNLTWWVFEKTRTAKKRRR